MEYEARDAKRILADARLAKHPRLYERAKLESAKKLVAAVAEAAKEAGFQVADAKDEKAPGTMYVVPDDSERALIWIQPNADHGVTLGWRSDGGQGHPIEVALAYDPATDLWTGRDDESNAPAPESTPQPRTKKSDDDTEKKPPKKEEEDDPAAAHAKAKRSAVDVVAEALAAELGNLA